MESIDLETVWWIVSSCVSALSRLFSGPAQAAEPAAISPSAAPGAASGAGGRVGARALEPDQEGASRRRRHRGRERPIGAHSVGAADDDFEVWRDVAALPVPRQLGSDLAWVGQANLHGNRVIPVSAGAVSGTGGDALTVGAANSRDHKIGGTFEASDVYPAFRVAKGLGESNLTHGGYSRHAPSQGQAPWGDRPDQSHHRCGTHLIEAQCKKIT